MRDTYGELRSFSQIVVLYVPLDSVRGRDALRTGTFKGLGIIMSSHFETTVLHVATSILQSTFKLPHTAPKLCVYHHRTYY